MGLTGDYYSQALSIECSFCSSWFPVARLMRAVYRSVAARRIGTLALV